MARCRTHSAPRVTLATPRSATRRREAIRSPPAATLTAASPVDVTRTLATSPRQAFVCTTLSCTPAVCSKGRSHPSSGRPARRARSGLAVPAGLAGSDVPLVPRAGAAALLYLHGCLPVNTNRRAHNAPSLLRVPRRGGSINELATVTERQMKWLAACVLHVLVQHDCIKLDVFAS